MTRVTAYAEEDVRFFLFPFLGSARIQYLDADKYIYEGPYSIAFHSICNSTELSVIIFSRMCGPRRHIARTRPLISEAVMCFHAQFDHFGAVKENASYVLELSFELYRTVVRY